MTVNERCQALEDELDKIKRHDGTSQEWEVEYSFNGRRWYVHVEEADDGHFFVGGSGSTPDEAAENAIADLETAAKGWGWFYQP